jgi:hypothetical protein
VKHVRGLVSFPFTNRDGIPLKRLTSLVSCPAQSTVQQINRLIKQSRIANTFIFIAFAPSGFFRLQAKAAERRYVCSKREKAFQRQPGTLKSLVFVRDQHTPLLTCRNLHPNG